MVKMIAGNFLRHPRQLNKLFEADAEIIDFRNQSPDYLVLKTDGIHEEIKEKLYEDPYLIGWMAVTVTMSDLAAVGAEPFGILLSLQLAQNFDSSWMENFQQGINDACAVYQVQILGGDTNFGKDTLVSTTGIATIVDTRPMLRKQMAPGDLLYATGRLGGGNAFAYARFFDSSLDVEYKPIARIHESKLIRAFASTCIDTSDGLFPALSVLSELNEVGVRFSQPLQDYLCEPTQEASVRSGIPAWMFLAGPHGEYELLFTVSPSLRKEFLIACSAHHFQPVFLGEIIAEKKIEFVSEEIAVICEPSEIANLFREAGDNIQKYYQILMNKHKQWIMPGFHYAD